MTGAGILIGALTIGPPVSSGPHAITFVIDMRAEIAAGRFHPARDRVGVRGGIAPLSWDETLRATDPDGDGRYEVVVTFPRAPFGGQGVTYKFKVDRAEAPRDGWEEGRNRQLFLREPAQSVSRPYNAPAEPITPSRAGTIRMHRAFPSKFAEARDVQVWLPPGYEREKGRRYPVLYLQDGQNVFDAAEMGMEWQVDETADALVRAGRIEPLIVVAVANTAARRDEYAPISIERKRPDGTVERAGGKANLYARFFVEELKPFVDRTYRTQRDPAGTALGGASFGALVSLWLALEHPDVFGNVLAVSPALRWNEEAVLKRIAAAGNPVPMRIWVDIGTGEGKNAVAETRRLRDALTRKGWKPGETLEYVEQVDGQHDEISWASRVEPMLLFLDRRWRRPEDRR